MAEWAQDLDAVNAFTVLADGLAPALELSLRRSGAVKKIVQPRRERASAGR